MCGMKLRHRFLPEERHFARARKRGQLAKRGLPRGRQRQLQSAVAAGVDLSELRAQATDDGPAAT
jgi:hypothetical protein